jgi:hypothetical protein
MKRLVFGSQNVWIIVKMVGSPVGSHLDNKLVHETAVNQDFWKKPPIAKLSKGGPAVSSLLGNLGDVA